MKCAPLEVALSLRAEQVGGTHRYAYRVSLDRGFTWTYCDTAQGDFGARSNAGLTFDLDSLGVLTVTP